MFAVGNLEEAVRVEEVASETPEPPAKATDEKKVDEVPPVEKNAKLALGTQDKIHLFFLHVLSAGTATTAHVVPRTEPPRSEILGGGTKGGPEMESRPRTSLRYQVEIQLLRVACSLLTS